MALICLDLQSKPGRPHRIRLCNFYALLALASGCADGLAFRAGFFGTSNPVKVAIGFSTKHHATADIEYASKK
jgi:hypothetical protein